MYDTGTVGGGYVIVAHYKESVLAACGLFGALKQGLVVLVFKLLTGYFLYYFNFVALENAGYQLFGEYQGLFAVNLGVYVYDVGVYAQGNVAGQGPGGGGPCQEVGVFLIGHDEADGCGGFLYVLIALSYLVGGEGGTAAGAVGNYLVALVEEALFVDSLQCPPLGFDIVILVGDVGVIHVCPEAHAVGHYFPLALVLPYGFLALVDEGDNAVFFYLLLAVQAQLLFNFQLYGQAVGIPAGLAQHVIALHGLVAGYDVLHGAGQHVADVGLAVGGWGTVVEGIGGGALTQLYALFKDAVLLPEFQRLFFTGYEIQ